MTTYAWPGWGARNFELRLVPNVRVFVGPYTPAVQAIDLLGERWQMRFDLVPTTSSIEAAAREAFFDRLKGQLNYVTLPNLRLLVPQGTMRGSPVLTSAVAQLANTLPITTTAGATLLAGDMIGCNGQLFRVMANATADGAGNMMVEVQGRTRTAISGGTAVVWNQPTSNFIMKSPDGVPTVWGGGAVPEVAGASLEWIEVW